MSTVRALTADQRRELEQELLSELARLERRIERVVGADAPAADDSHDAGGVSSVGAHTSVAAQVRDRTRARHAAITDALERMRDGTYGICSRCRSAIPFGRLAVMPEATHCVACG